jgi:hypothetical protein
MKYLFLTLLCAVSYGSEPTVHPISGSELTSFAGEQLRFSLHRMGVAAAEAQITCSANAPDTLLISANIQTSFLINLFFPIHNLYQTYIERNTGSVLGISNFIKQKNISHTLSVRYDRNQGQAFGSNGQQWSAPAESQTLFAMLYQLRHLAVEAGDSVTCLLDVESQLCRISGRLHSGDAVDGPFSDLPVREVVLQFRPEHGDLRGWKTDLLTNRMSRSHTQLLVRLGPRPESLPLWIQVGEGKGSVIMKLRARKRT